MDAQYQCQFSSQQSGQVFIPNIPDLYFTPENAAARFGGNLTETSQQNGTTYIFTLPALSSERNCSGTVLSLQYCFLARARDIGNTLSVFDLLSLTRDGNQFTVNERFAPPQITLRQDMCADPPEMGMRRVCCTTVSLESGQVQVPASAFTFGVLTNVRLLTFVDRVNVERFTYRPTGNSELTRGSTFQGSSRMNSSLLLLRFFLGN